MANSDSFQHSAGAAEISEIPIAHLGPPICPRVKGVDRSHARVLSEVFDHLPAILVHRATMHVIDGMHRIEAALLLGRITIQARFFVGEDQDALLLGIKENSSHGLPLSLKDRRFAASRVLATNPEWSDRRIGLHVGLSGKTVASVRKSLGGANVSIARIGQDGRARRINRCPETECEAKVIDSNNEISIRGISQTSGNQQSRTRHTPRKILRQGSQVNQNSDRSADLRVPPTEPYRKYEILQQLTRNPAIRMSSNSRKLLRLLSIHPVALEQEVVVLDLPAHCLSNLAELARYNADQWIRLAETMEKRALQEGI